MPYVEWCVAVVAAFSQGADRAAKGQRSDQDSRPGGSAERPAQHKGGAEGHLGAAETGGPAGEECSSDAGEGLCVVAVRHMTTCLISHDHTSHDHRPDDHTPHDTMP